LKDVDFKFTKKIRIPRKISTVNQLEKLEKVLDDDEKKPVLGE
jgi:hypothetical protein